MEYATALFSTASSLVARSALSSSYTLASHAQGPNAHPPAPIQIGVWRVERATHNSNGKVVSIWTCDRSHLASGGSGGGARAASGSARRLEKTIEVLRKETHSLSRLRHPCILEMAEPMEETRSSITFATEPVTASLRHAISASASAADATRRGRVNKGDEDLELDEVEIQKGLSQIGKGLQFLHESAKLVHGNLTPDSIIINAKGDWKLSGFGMSTYLFGPDGVPAKWEFPEYDHGMPASCQRDYDYCAPEYLLDESPPAPSNDLYSLGCVIHAIHTKTGPPFSNRNNLENARTNIEEGLSRGMVRPLWRKLSDEAQSVLSQLVTRYPSTRLSATTFLTHSYFSSLLVSTLRFLERDSFAAQSSEAQVNFLRGLIGVLPRFSDKVTRRKVLPCLLEETRKSGLVPFLLPNILFIASKMDTETFREEALPQIKPLFSIKEPPQAVVSLLDNLPLFIEKCTPTVFREEVMPLVYGALESDNPVVLEKALRVVPGLSETLDYTTVKQILFPKITQVFTKTTLLSVKVNTLICFHSMIKTLDKFTLTEKLVPLLAKIKTKEPSVMVATLAVHEEIGKKCEIEAIATLILPQLWAMSMGPLLNAAQFAKFMKVIHVLGDRVEEEHSKQLGELKRLDEGSNGGGGGIQNGEIDFESLVRGGGGLWAEENRSHTPSLMSPGPTPPASFQSSPFQQQPPPASPARQPSFSAHSNPTRSSLGARTIPSTSFNASIFDSPPPPSPSNPISSFPIHSPPAATPAPRPGGGPGSFAPLQPSRNGTGPTASHAPAASMNSGGMASGSYSTGRPNYDLSFSSQPPLPSSAIAPPSGSMYGQPLQPQMSSYAQPLQPQTSSSTYSQPSYSQPSYSQPSYSQPLQPARPQQARPAPTPAAPPAWNVLPPPGFQAGNVLVPTPAPKQPPASGNFGNWADLDPLG